MTSARLAQRRATPLGIREEGRPIVVDDARTGVGDPDRFALDVRQLLGRDGA